MLSCLRMLMETNRGSTTVWRVSISRSLHQSSFSNIVTRLQVQVVDPLKALCTCASRPLHQTAAIRIIVAGIDIVLCFTAVSKVAMALPGDCARWLLQL
jgi:hypothetical protein